MQAFHVLGPAPLYTNTFLLISDAGRGVIIDPAAPAQEYEALLAEHGATLAAVLCTHGHYDHVGSAAALREKWKVPLHCEPEDLVGSEMYPLREADGGYAEDGTFEIDELSFRVWHTPGHTRGSVVLLCGEYLFCGDTLFQGSIGRTDLPGGDARQMDASLRKLAALPIPRETQVLPGHGDFSQFGWELDNNWYIRNACRAHKNKDRNDP